MNAHLRANLWLLGLTVLLCSVLYPLVLWGIGRGLFPNKASGSLIGRDGKPVSKDSEAIGSRLIGQPFNGPEYFQPRPSSPSYDASASGGSNYSANNPKLRARVAQDLGPIVKYRSGSKKDQLVGPDIEKWFQQDHYKGKPGIVAQWAQRYPFDAQEWVKKNADIPEVKAAQEQPVSFFIQFSNQHPGKWPRVVEQKTAKGKTEKHLEPVPKNTDIQRYFFDMWLQEHPDVELVEVPADMVMASGSGLDPHITLKNARYQLDRVATAWADKSKVDQVKVRKAIEDLLSRKAEAPFGGLVGVELINVLEVNLALKDLMKDL
jgi:potassium-transporting ATPase KdpC subunit